MIDIDVESEIPEMQMPLEANSPSALPADLSSRIRIPRGQDMIQVGDTVIIVTTHKGLRDITDILEK